MTKPFVLPLTEINRNDLPIAGGKGANLGELVQAGFEVPDGFVVTTAAYDAFAHGLGDDLAARTAAERAALFASGELPVGLAEAVASAYSQLGSPAVAVRSSATAEDLPGASFAGQQDTFLNISGSEAVIEAIRRCWASLWGDRAIAYRSRRAGHSGVSIAVVVQRLVTAEVAGVLFTANPVNGRRDQSVITAAWGLGEAVVSGLTEPDEYQVTGEQVTARVAAKAVMTVPTPTGVAQVETADELRRVRTLTDEEATELAGLGRLIAEHFGQPQDIEWARDADGDLLLLQARPITALPEPTGPIPTDWTVPRRHSMYFRASIVEQLPDPLSPLFAGLIETAVPAGLRSLIGELGSAKVPVDIDFPTINGYAYYDYSYRTLAAWTALTPTLLGKIGRPGFVKERWAKQALPRYRETVAKWRDRDPAGLKAVELLAGAQELVDAACEYYTSVQSIIPIAASSELIWTAVYDRLLKRPGDPAASDFLLGYDSAPILAEKALFTLARWCREQPGLVEALQAGAVPGGSRPKGVKSSRWREFTDRFDAHLREHGFMLYNLDLINPVPADDPTTILSGLSHDLSGDATDPYLRQAGQVANRDAITADLLARLGPGRTHGVRRSLRAAQEWGPIREDALAQMGLGWPTARRLLNELGVRMAAAGAIETAADVYWITRPEAEVGAGRLDRKASPDQLAGHVEDRKLTHRGQALATPPQTLPESVAARLVERWMPAKGQSDGPTLEGTAGTGGKVTGPARVLRTPADFGAFQTGEILVAAITTPAYTPLFARAAAVVTDIGGVLSHGSIVAREYGIPAVLGTGAATSRIRTGDVITVDGARARVELEDQPEMPTPAAGVNPAWWWALAAAGATTGAILWWRHHRANSKPERLPSDR